MRGAIRRTELHFRGGAGRGLFRRAWLPREAERVLVLVHGYAEHSGRYEPFGAWFAARGCAVYAYDQQGHGLSEGPRGHAASLDVLLDDLDALLDQVDAAHPGLARFVVGHSMGGLEVLEWACRPGSEAAGVVVSAAALALPSLPPAWQRRLLRLARRVAPRVRIAHPVAEEALSRDPEVGRRYREDPLIFQHMTLSLAVALVDGAAAALASPGRARLPMLLLHGADDPIASAEGSRDFYRDLEASGSELHVYPGLRHEIFNEPEREQVFADVFDWLSRRTALAGAPASASGAA